MQPTFFASTRRVTDWAIGQAIQWWTLKGDPSAPDVSASVVRIGLTRLYRAGMRDDIMET